MLPVPWVLNNALILEQENQDDHYCNSSHDSWFRSTQNWVLLKNERGHIHDTLMLQIPSIKIVCSNYSAIELNQWSNTSRWPPLWRRWWRAPSRRVTPKKRSRHGGRTWRTRCSTHSWSWVRFDTSTQLSDMVPGNQTNRSGKYWIDNPTQAWSHCLSTWCPTPQWSARWTRTTRPIKISRTTK